MMTGALMIVLIMIIILKTEMIIIMITIVVTVIIMMMISRTTMKIIITMMIIKDRLNDTQWIIKLTIKKEITRTIKMVIKIKKIAKENQREHKIPCCPRESTRGLVWGTRTHAHTRTCTHTHTHDLIHTHECTHIHAHAHMHSYTRTCTHTRTHTHARTHTFLMMLRSGVLYANTNTNDAAYIKAGAGVLRFYVYIIRQNAGEAFLCEKIWIRKGRTRRKKEGVRGRIVGWEGKRDKR